MSQSLHKSPRRGANHFKAPHWQDGRLSEQGREHIAQRLLDHAAHELEYRHDIALCAADMLPFLTPDKRLPLLKKILTFVTKTDADAHAVFVSEIANSLPPDDCHRFAEELLCGGAHDGPSAVPARVSKRTALTAFLIALDNERRAHAVAGVINGITEAACLDDKRDAVGTLARIHATLDDETKSRVDDAMAMLSGHAEPEVALLAQAFRSGVAKTVCENPFSVATTAPDDTFDENARIVQNYHDSA